MSLAFRIALATEGFRGGSSGGVGPGQNIYITEVVELIESINSVSVNLVEPSFAVTLEEATVDVSVEYVSTEVASIEIEGAY